MDILLEILSKTTIANSFDNIFLAALAYSLIVFSIGNIWETKENVVQRKIKAIEDDVNLTKNQKDSLISRIRLLNISIYQEMPKNFFHCIILSFSGLVISVLYSLIPLLLFMIVNMILTAIIVKKLEYNTRILHAVFELPDKIDREIKKYTDLFYAIDSEDYETILNKGND